MRILDHELICSATDLVGFSACAHLTELELRAGAGELERPTRDDPLLAVLSERGGEHERAVLEKIDREVVEIHVDSSTRAGLETATADTIAAMRAGAEVIYQATFLYDGWVGHADFVERVPTPSDAKLARSVKASALLQLCDYSAHVERIQGFVPLHIHVDTGDGKRHTLRLADYSAFASHIVTVSKGETVRIDVTVKAAPSQIYAWTPVLDLVVDGREKTLNLDQGHDYATAPLPPRPGAVWQWAWSQQVPRFVQCARESCPELWGEVPQ